MKTRTEKAVKTALLFALPLTIFIVAYLLYNQSTLSTPPEHFVRYGDNGLRPEDSIQLARVQASIDKQLDSLERYPPPEWLDTYYTDMLSKPKQDTSLVTEKRDAPSPNKRTGIWGADALHGPSALFTHTYSLRIGKPVPVSVLWASDSAFLPVKLQLATITLNDVADDKAGFTLADPSAVLLYSGAQYAVNDKIAIEDNNHNLHISVLQVHPDSVRIEFSYYLTDAVVSKLKGWE